jgi:hypothetical protein
MDFFCMAAGGMATGRVSEAGLLLSIIGRGCLNESQSGAIIYRQRRRRAVEYAQEHVGPGEMEDQHN